MKYLEIAGILASLSSWMFAYYSWHGEPRARNVFAFLTGIVFLVLSVVVHRRMRSISKVPDENVILERIPLQLSDEYEHEVFHKTPFVRPPFLTVRCIAGSKQIELTEQRPDGFKFRLSGSGYALGDHIIVVEFCAKGQLGHASYDAGG